MSVPHRPRLIALDLEGTIVSSVVSQFPRPGLRLFQEEALGLLPPLDGRPAIRWFSAAPVTRVDRMIALLVDEGEMPQAALQISHVPWSRKGPKDLRLTGITAEEVLLVDDQERVVLPEQRGQWVCAREWDMPYPSHDRELEVVMQVLRARCA